MPDVRHNAKKMKPKMIKEIPTNVKPNTERSIMINQQVIQF